MLETPIIDIFFTNLFHPPLKQKITWSAGFPSFSVNSKKRGRLHLLVMTKKSFQGHASFHARQTTNYSSGLREKTVFNLFEMS